MGHTQIEMEAMRAQIAQAKALHENMPKILQALERIALAMEVSQGYMVEGVFVDEGAEETK